MRIEGPGNRNVVGKSRKAGGQGGDARFSTGESADAQRPAAAAPSRPATAIDSILALQSVDDPLLAKRRAVKHGHALLDTLEEVKADLLVGRISEGRLNRVMALVSRARQSTDPEIEALIDDIELRAQVELAKLGRFAN